MFQIGHPGGRPSLLFALTLGSVLVWSAAGCGKSEGPGAQGKPGSDAQSSAAEDRKNVEQLPPGDREAALKQQLCAVSGKPLGSMGVPVKAAIGDRSVFLCCKGCDATVKREPDKVLRRADELIAPKDAGK